MEHFLGIDVSTATLDVEGDLQDAIAASPLYHAKAALLRSVLGVGQVTMLTLLATPA